MNKFKAYLKDTRAALENSDSEIHLVMGNTSGDLDSIVGALGLAYYLTLKTKNLWTPVVNCKRSELKLKVEIYLHLIDDCGINFEELIFWDDLIPPKSPITQICLIDHNKIDAKQALELGPDSHSKVKLIYDHHLDNKAYPDEQLQEKIVKFIGSACSIAALKMKEDKDLFTEDDLTDGKNFAYFFAAAIVVDTYNFKPALKNLKWQEEDLDAYNWLAAHADIGKDYFDKMHDVKFSQEVAIKLGVLGNLYRDFKNYRISRSGASGVLGLSVMVF